MLPVGFIQGFAIDDEFIRNSGGRHRIRLYHAVIMLILQGLPGNGFFIDFYLLNAYRWLFIVPVKSIVIEPDQWRFCTVGGHPENPILVNKHAVIARGL